VAGCFNALFARADVYLGWHSRTHSHTLKGLKGLAGYSLSVGLSGQKSLARPRGQMEMETQLPRPTGDYPTNCSANVTIPKRMGGANLQD